MNTEAKSGFAIYSPPLITRDGQLLKTGGYLPNESGDVLICETKEDATKTATGAALMYGIPFVLKVWPITTC